MTLIAEGHVPDEVWERASDAIGEELASSSSRSPRSTLGTG